MFLYSTTLNSFLGKHFFALQSASGLVFFFFQFHNKSKQRKMWFDTESIFLLIIHRIGISFVMWSEKETWGFESTLSGEVSPSAYEKYE